MEGTNTLIGPDLTTSEAYAEMLARFTQYGIVNTPDEAERSRRVEVAIDAACVLLGSAQFQNQPTSSKVQIIRTVSGMLMSRPNQNLPIIAELGLRRFRGLLEEADLTEREMCQVYDALHGIYFAGITDVRDLRRFDAIVPTIETWLRSRVGKVPDLPPPCSPEAHLTIAYLMHTGHLDRGNAVTPLIVSLAQMHSQRGNRRILVYLVEYVAPEFLSHLESLGLEVRSFHQYGTYERIDDLANSIKNDRVDVVITEQNRSIGAALFVRRVAPLQIWLDTGFPFWSLTALDWAIAPARPAGTDISRTSHITWRQTVETLKRTVDPAEVLAIRDQLPPNRFILGVFVRLIKLDQAYLKFLGRLLGSNPLFHLIIAGPGESAFVDAFCKDPQRSGRVTFIPGNVDLNVFGPAIDVMCDTFPFVGGNACREVTAHGTPVVSKLGTSWDELLKSDRSPDLLASSEDDYIKLVNRLSSDEVFLQDQRQVALAMAARYVDPTKMIDDVEHAIVAASAHRFGSAQPYGQT